MIPNVGTMTPIKMSEEAGMNRTVLAKRTAVEVMVVKPRMKYLSGYIPRQCTGKRQTIREEEPRRQVLEGIP